jgi:hypothetical protein
MYLCICVYVYMCVCVFICEVVERYIYIRALSVPLDVANESYEKYLMVRVFVYMCVCVYVYICVCVV